MVDSKKNYKFDPAVKVLNSLKIKSGECIMMLTKDGL